MKSKVNRRQQIRLFLANFLSFAVIFISFGLIIYGAFSNAVFRQVDQSILIQRDELLGKSTRKINNKIGNNTNQQMSSSANSGSGPVTASSSSAIDGQRVDPPIDFKTSFVVYDSKGNITNQGMLGERYDTVETVKLDKSNLDKLINITVSTNKTFRSYLLKIPSSVNSPYAGKYVNILQNIDSENQAVILFRRILIIAVLAFWLLSILISFAMSRLNMRPILKSWDRQQEFVGNAAHELKTPLAIIQSKQEYLLTKPNAKILDETEPIAISLSEIRRLNQLTSDLLLLARGDSNMTQIEREQTDMPDFFAKVIEPYHEIADSQGKQFNVDLSVNGYLRIDQKRIHQLCVILLDNALKYTNTGETINFVVNQTQKQLFITVADDGVGVSDENKQKIFDRFYRVDAAHSKQVSGNGLGLSIAKWIVESHHGKIKVADNTPQGVKFEVVLPI